MSFVPGWGRFSTNLLISKKSLHLLSLILKVWYSWLRLETVLSGQLKSFLGTKALDWRSLIACRIDINQLLRSDFVYCKPMSRRTVQKRVPNKQTRSEKAASISELAVNQQANAFWTTRLERHLVFGTVCSKRQVMFGTSSSERIRLLVYSKFANRWRFSRTRLFDRNAFFHRSSRHGYCLFSPLSSHAYIYWSSNNEILEIWSSNTRNIFVHVSLTTILAFIENVMLFSDISSIMSVVTILSYSPFFALFFFPSWSIKMDLEIFSVFIACCQSFIFRWVRSWWNHTIIKMILQ